MDLKDLSLQEKEIIFALRRIIPFERIEILKTQEGRLGFDYIVFSAHKTKIDPIGNKTGQNVRKDLV